MYSIYTHHYLEYDRSPFLSSIPSNYINLQRETEMINFFYCVIITCHADYSTCLIYSAILNAVDYFYCVMATTWCPEDSSTPFMNVVYNLRRQWNRVPGIKALVATLQNLQNSVHSFWLCKETRFLSFQLIPSPECLFWSCIRIWMFRGRDGKLENLYNREDEGRGMELMYNSLLFRGPFWRRTYNPSHRRFPWSQCWVLGRAPRKWQYRHGHRPDQNKPTITAFIYKFHWLWT